MTDRHPDILTVRHAEILRRLRRVVDAGEYYNSFTADDVVHVATHWLVPREACVVPLRVVADDGTPIVALPKGQAEAIRTLADNPGASNYDLGVLLGISADAAKDRLRVAYIAMGVHSRTEVVELVTSGKVRIVVKESNRKKAS